MTVQSIEKHILKLSAQERAKLAGVLLSSLDDIADSETEALWAEESLKRHQDVLKGKATTKPAAIVFKKARSRVR